MNTLLITVLSLSLSGAILIAVLFLCKPLYKERLSKRWQYYVWLIVIVRLMLPLTFEVNLVGSLFDRVNQTSVAVESEAMSINNDGLLFVTPNYPGIGLHTPNIHNNIPYSQGTIPGTQSLHLQPNNPITQVAASYSQVDIWGLMLPNLWLLWLMVAIMLFVRKVTIYQSFVRYIKAGRVEVDNIEIMERLGKILEQENIGRTIDIYTHSHISSPLLIGFFRPYIVLPTLEISETDFRYTILHELIHYKRGDMFYKWLVQLVICLHWFNPLVHLMGREINYLGELSCDEAVIKNLDNDGMRAYGDNLLNASKWGGEYSNALASVTLNSNKKIIKERLDLIMKFKKKSKLVAVVAICATILLTIGAVATGAYAVTSQTPAAYGNTTETSQLPSAITNHAPITNEALYNENLSEWYEWFNSLTTEQQDMVSFRPSSISTPSVTELEHDSRLITHTQGSRTTITIDIPHIYSSSNQFSPTEQVFIGSVSPGDVVTFDIYTDSGSSPVLGWADNKDLTTRPVSMFFSSRPGGRNSDTFTVEIESQANYLFVMIFSGRQEATYLRGTVIIDRQATTQQSNYALEAALARALEADYTFAQNTVAGNREWAEAQVAASGNRSDRREWADNWIASRYEWKEDWLASRHKWADNIRSTAVWATNISQPFTDVFAGIEAFGITFGGSLADWDTLNNPGNIYYRGRLVNSIIDDNFFNENTLMTHRFMITSGRRSPSDISSRLVIHVLRDINGNITGVNIIGN